MVYEPYVLAIVLGLLISAALYFVLMWPQIEPDDGDDDGDDGAELLDASAPGAEPPDRLSSTS